MTETIVSLVSQCFVDDSRKSQSVRSYNRNVQPEQQANNCVRSFGINGRYRLQGQFEERKREKLKVYNTIKSLMKAWIV